MGPQTFESFRAVSEEDFCKLCGIRNRSKILRLERD